MACPSYFDALRIPTESLNEIITSIPSPDTPYYNFVRRGTFKKNSGVNQTNFRIGRIEPTSKSDGWSDVSLSNNVVTGGACSPSFTEVPVGFSEDTYAPRKLQLKGPSFCRETFTYAHNPRAFLKEYIRALTRIVKSKINLEFQDQTIQMGYKYVATATGLSSAFTSTSLPTTKPGSMPTWDIMDLVAADLIFRGAANVDGDVIELGGEGPVFPAFIGMQLLQRLFTNVAAVREDFRQADMGKGTMAATLRAMGASRKYKNFRFVPLAYPPRYTWNNTTLVYVEPFEDEALTHGTGQTVTAAYQNAEYEAIVIPNEAAWSADIVTPDNAGLNFNPTSYNGEWEFVTGGNNIVNGNVCYDPLKDWGAHFSRFVYAPHTMRPETISVLFVKRCQNDVTVAACTSGS